MANVGRRDAMTRTAVAFLGAAAGAHLLTGCGPPDPQDPLPPACEPNGDDPSLGWTPSVVTPVFYGYADYNQGVGAPTNLRVYYPSADGAPQCAPFLTGTYPLVLFLHGQCNAAPAERHYTRWSHLPAVLARCGYVVAIPEISGLEDPWSAGSTTYTPIMGVIDWMRMSWSRRANLNSRLGIAGHSFGALHGAQVATMVPTDSFVSIGGVWSAWPGSPPNPLNSLSIPKLLAVGTGAVDEGVTFSRPPAPKHRIQFPDGTHWDYVPPANTECDKGDPTSPGPCNQVFAIVADLTAIFLSKFMPPSTAIGTIPDNLTLPPPPTPLTFAQQGFVGGHLMSLTTVGSHPGCGPVKIDWETSLGSGMRLIV